MKKILLFILSFFSVITLSGQVIKGQTKGTVYDYYSRTPLDSVKVTSRILDTSVFSDNRGGFAIPAPPKYYDTLVFTRPGYYPFVRVSKKTGFRIWLIPETVEIDTFCYPSYTENRLIRGTIVGKYLKRPVPGAAVRLWNDQIIAWSDRYGKFSAGIPRNTKMLKISHPDYDPRIAEFKKGTPMITIKLLKTTLRREDTLWKSFKNSVGIIPLELFTGSIGLMYERFIRLRHSIGVYSSVYLLGYGVNPFGGGMSKYKGFKVSPFYRFYVWRNVKNGGFVQGKAILGYFNFSRLYYAVDDDSSIGEYRQEQFWNAGFGVGWGWSFKLPRAMHGVCNLTLGYQYFTMSVPPTITSNHYGVMDVKSFWWYFNGPGSMFEMKLVFGGIF